MTMTLTMPGAVDAPTVAAVLARVDELPPISAVARRVGELVNDPNSSAEDVATLMRSDPALSAAVLKLANSAQFAIPGGVSDVHRAISFIGFSAVYQLALSVSVVGSLRLPKDSGFDPGGIWLHSLAVGTCAELIAKRVGGADPSTCFTAGLLHDVGKFALALASPVLFAEAYQRARQGNVSMARAERDVGLPAHHRVGARLALRWRLPAPLLLSIAHHEDAADESVRRGIAASLLRTVEIVAAADALCLRAGIGDGGSSAMHDIGRILAVGLEEDEQEAIIQATLAALESNVAFAELLSIDSAALGSVTAKQAPRSAARR